MSVENMGNLPSFVNSTWYMSRPRWEVVRDALPIVDLLENETVSSVRAVLGHRLLGYIHPYPDGNGRLARCLMITMLASGGYPWTGIRMDCRDTDLDALEHACVLQDIEPFAQFIADQMKWSVDLLCMEGHPSGNGSGGGT